MIFSVCTNVVVCVCWTVITAQIAATVTRIAKFAMESVGRMMMENRRELDGVYFRIKRDGKWHNICFTDLTKEERDKVCENRSAEWFKSLAYHLAGQIQYIGETFVIVAEG